MAKKQIEIFFFTAGHCLQREYLALSSGKMKKLRFPALFVLIKHPERGNILFDTGYSRRFFSATAKLPYRIYAKLTPVHLMPGESAVEQLQAVGVTPQSVETVVISHFHADHIGGLQDFPAARFICAQTAYDAIKGKTGFSALLKGYLPQQMPDNFAARVTFVEEFSQFNHPDLPFQAYDLLGDASLVAVELPGHAPGQLGLLAGEEFLMVSDACWLRESYEKNTPPHKLVRFLGDNWDEYLATLAQLHNLSINSQYKIVPSHCEESITGILNEK